MIKKILAVLLLLAIFLGIFLIGNRKSLTCDGCGKTIRVSKNSEMQDDWIIYCNDCNSLMNGELTDEE